MRAALASGGTSAEPIYRAVLAQARSLGVSNDVLDFGAGRGLLIEELLTSTFSGRLAGADLLPRPPTLPPSVRWIQCDLNEPLAVPSCAFDVIVSVEVIEHLENPRAVFREFHRLLKPCGNLLLSTPNQESLRAIASLVTRGHFVDFLDTSYPAHITALVRRDFVRIAAETGFEPPRFLYTDVGGVPLWPAMKWQRVSGGLLRGRRFSDNMLVVTRRDARPC
jgi:2-polyprenyl-3-methyl-5-hydroxy-6-metoxy-1,4-benzoquinol methylase